MNVGFMGRTRMLLDTINIIRHDDTHQIAFIWTSKSEPYYNCHEDEFQHVAQRLNCPFIYSSNIDGIDKGIDLSKVDLVISINFVNILSATFLNQFQFGVLNAHAGDLPRYKGNACPNWAILNDENSISLSIHQMSAELDSGPIYTTRIFPLNDNTYIGDVYNWLGLEVPRGFLDVINSIQKGVSPTPQKDVRSLRTFPRKAEDAEIDWCQGIESIHRLIRASSRPFDGAYCHLNGTIDNRVTVFKARVIELPYDFCAINGQILERHKDSFVVASGNSALEVFDFKLNELTQTESLKKITASLRNRLT
ncbi:MAG: hypothetical protein COB51_08145 [Moraxellaceae bacterium]|nr:MAG: hypothetical protein COB51_08145 [Moraxellaceae bacterium]